MKNLMDELTLIHNTFRSTIRKLEKELWELEKNTRD